MAKRQDTWTGQMADMLSNPKRMYMKEFVERQGFNKKIKKLGQKYFNRIEKRTADQNF